MAPLDMHLLQQLLLCTLLTSVAAQLLSYQSYPKCNSVCSACPDGQGKSVCEVGRKLRTYPCFCKLEAAMCRKQLDLVLLHKGPCKKPRQYSMSNIKNFKFYTLWKKPDYLADYESGTRSKGVPMRKSTENFKLHPNLPTKKEAVPCELFFSDDKMFRRMYRNRHFECSSLDPSKSAILVDPLY